MICHACYLPQLDEMRRGKSRDRKGGLWIGTVCCLDMGMGAFQASASSLILLFLCQLSNLSVTYPLQASTAGRQYGNPEYTEYGRS